MADAAHDLLASTARGADFEVDRTDLRATRVRDAPVPVPADGEALVRVERFGCTANNILYAKLGEWLYWKFFPTEAGWGRLPAWGVGEVVDAGTTDLEPGARILGCVPMASHLVVTPTRHDEARFVDGAEHRDGLPSAYGNYTFLPPGSDKADEDLQLLLRPLYFTAFLVVDMFASEQHFGAEHVVVSSASSKTALGVARLLADLEVRTVGLTSAGHTAFVEGLGVYDEVIDYDALSSLPAKPAAFIDVAGSAAVRRAVHTHYGPELAHSAKVGSTHWDAPPDAPDPDDLPGPAPTLFFAPDRMSARARDWGRDGLNDRFAAAWEALAAWTATWLRVEHRTGPEAVRAVYLDVLDGRVSPEVAHVLSL
jgi:NADPH:quinone reductase-like Zn-dependent oxidoreductase